MATAPPDFLSSTSRPCRRRTSSAGRTRSSATRLCLTCSWQKQSSVLVHMVSELGLPIDVVELDTHLFFRESYETRERLVERYGLELIQPEIITVAEQHKREGPNLWERDPDRCCHIRKVEPLIQALAPYDAWISGIRRDQSPSRAGTPKLAWSSRYGVWKIHPLADWDEKRVWAYITVNEIPYNPLHDVGYRSIGCIPCTRPTSPDEEERAGRWAGSDKLECGIHHRHRKGTHDRAHLRSRASPSPSAAADGGFTLWFTGLSGSGKTHDRPPRRPRARGARRDRRVPGRRHGPHAPLEGARLLEGGPRHEHRAHRLGRVAADAPRRRRHRRRDLPVRGDARRRRARWSRSRARSSRCTSRRPSRSARDAT